MKFRVYYSKYGPERTFTGTSKTVGDAPIFEVLVIVQEDKDHGRKIITGGDYYVWDDEFGWISCDKETRDQYMARKGMRKRYLVGVMVSHEEWQETIIEARNDPDFPQQTALHLYETKTGYK